MLRATLLRYHLPTFLSTLFAQGSCICFLNLGEGDRNLMPQTHCPWGTLFLDCHTFSSLLLTLTSHGLDGRTDAPLPPLLPLTSGVTLWMVEDSSFPPSENGNGRLGSTGPGLTSASPSQLSSLPGLHLTVVGTCRQVQCLFTGCSCFPENSTLTYLSHPLTSYGFYMSLSKCRLL